MSTDLHPDFPVVSGDYAMTKGWRIKLEQDFNRRIDEGSLVLWRPELTFWINVWNSDGQVAVDDVLKRLLADASAQRTDEQIDSIGEMARLTYELSEDDAEREQSSERSINGFVIYPAGYVQIAAYYESPEARAAAYDIIRSVRVDT
jgi:hypothetical protein